MYSFIYKPKRNSSTGRFLHCLRCKFNRLNEECDKVEIQVKTSSYYTFSQIFFPKKRKQKKKKT